MKLIPEEQLLKFVGKPADRVSQNVVSRNKVRVNVWTKNFEKDETIPRWSIHRSYYLSYNSGEISDQTIREEKKDVTVY